jgi:hypothetical protein
VASRPLSFLMWLLEWYEYNESRAQLKPTPTNLSYSSAKSLPIVVNSKANKDGPVERDHCYQPDTLGLVSSGSLSALCTVPYLARRGDPFSVRGVLPAIRSNYTPFPGSMPNDFQGTNMSSTSMFMALKAFDDSCGCYSATTQ